MKVKRSEIVKLVHAAQCGDDPWPLMDLIDEAIAYGYEPEEPVIAPALVAEVRRELYALAHEWMRRDSTHGLRLSHLASKLDGRHGADTRGGEGRS